MTILYLYFLRRYNITTDDAPREFTAEDNDK